MYHILLNCFSHSLECIKHFFQLISCTVLSSLCRGENAKSSSEFLISWILKTILRLEIETFYVRRYFVERSIVMKIVILSIILCFGASTNECLCYGNKNKCKASKRIYKQWWETTKKPVSPWYNITTLHCLVSFFHCN